MKKNYKNVKNKYKKYIKKYEIKRPHKKSKGEAKSLT